MSANSEQLLPPNEPGAFESLCLDLWKDIWNDPGAQPNGRRGQPQAGVDVFGKMNGKLIGVQCKQKDGLLGTKVTAKELEREVFKARKFVPKLCEFILATSGPADAKVQERARQLSEDHRVKSLFSVEVWSWERIWHELYGREELLSRIGPVYWPRQWEARQFQRKHRAHNLPYVSLGPLFMGRESSIDLLRQKMTRGASPPTAIQPKEVLHGLGGVGKTRLAIEYAWRFVAQHTALLFVTAETPEAFRRNLAALGSIELLNLPDQGTQSEVARIEGVMNWLRGNGGWLLIIDNVDSEAAARVVEAMLPRLDRGHVLITSRLANWSGAVGTFELDVLDKEASIAFLLTRTKGRRKQTATDAAKAAALAEELGGLALALEQASAFIALKRCSLGDYLKRWHDHDRAVREWFDARLMQYPRSVAVAWNNTMAELCADAKIVLHLLSWMATEPVPISFLERARVLKLLRMPKLSDVPTPTYEDVVKAQASVAELGDALSELASYSLLKYDGHAVRIHRLVQEVTRSRMDLFDKDFWIFRVLGFAKELLADLKDKPFPDATKRQAAVHALAILEKIDPETSGDHFEVFNSEKLGGPLMNRLFCLQHLGFVAQLAAEVFSEDGAFIEAERCWAKAVIWRKQFPRSDTKMDDTLVLVLRKWAYALCRLGNIKALSLANEALDYALAAANRSDDTQRAILSATFHEVAIIRRTLDDLDGALLAIDEAITLVDRDHAKMVSDLAYRGEILFELSEKTVQAATKPALLERAKSDFSRAVRLLEDEAAATVQDAPYVRCKYGQCLLAIGQPHEAVPQLRLAMESFNSSYPPWHPDVLRACRSLVEAEAALRNDRTDLLKAAISQRRAKLGDDINVVRELHGLAGIHWRLGKSDVAARTEGEVFDLLTRISGDYSQTDLPGVYLTLSLIFAPAFSKEQLAQFRSRAIDYVNSRGLTWEAFRPQLLQMAPDYDDK